MGHDPLLPELRYRPRHPVLDGELVAWKKGVPHFPLLSRRLLNADPSIAGAYMVFDLLELDGKSFLGRPFSARRAYSGPLICSAIFLAFAGSPELFAAVCEHGREGIVAKRLAST